MINKPGQSTEDKAPKVTKRKLQAKETRNRIFETAFKLMEKDGFDNITIGQISKEANVSVGAFYHHFGSKNDILHEIFRRADDYFREHVMEGMAGKSTTEKILNYFKYYARFNSSLGLDHVRALYKTLSPIFDNSNRFMIMALQDIVNRGIEMNEIVTKLSTDEITDFLFSTARGLIFSWCFQNGSFSLEDKMYRYMNCQLRSLIPG